MDTKENNLENFMSDDNEYIIPVSWNVYSTVVVKGAKNLKQALDAVRDNLDDIPLSCNPEYVDGSYQIDADTAEDIINAQNYCTRGVLMELSKDNHPEMTIID